MALQDLLNSGSVGSYRCTYINVEPRQAFREDIREAMRAIIGAIATWSSSALEGSFVKDVGFDVFEHFVPGSGLTEVLRLWARANPRPLALLIEEFHALVGDSLIAVLRQFRTGYPNRPRELPQCVVLCGVRDLRDYRIQSGITGETVTGGGVFNISAGSLR